MNIEGPLTIEFRITDAQALREWEKLLGFKIAGDRVRLTREQYEWHALAIQGIQMRAAFRLKNSQS